MPTKTTQIPADERIPIRASTRPHRPPNRYLTAARRRIVITSLTRPELIRELQGTRADLRDALQREAELVVIEGEQRRALSAANVGLNLTATEANSKGAPCT